MIDIQLTGMCTGCSVADIRIETMYRNDGTTYNAAHCIHQEACERTKKMTELRAMSKSEERIQTQEAKWIPVNEQKPENYQKCLVCSYDGKIAVGAYTEAHGFFFPHYFEHEIAWMPLPEPYSEKE